MPQFQNFDELRSSKPGIWNSTNQDRVRHFKLLEKYKKMFLRELPDSYEDDVIDLTKIEYFCITSLVWQKAKRSENIERGFRVVAHRVIDGVPHNDKQERFRINEELMVMIRACDLNKRPMVHGDNAAAYYQSVAADAAAAAAAVEQALVDSAVAAVQAAARIVPPEQLLAAAPADAAAPAVVAAPAAGGGGGQGGGNGEPPVKRARRASGGKGIRAKHITS
jgi:hypothetical protein|tara:strand:- start:269 stop:934 length:666 start_codon:yes stop_codon:yes gene_type:complete